MGGGVMPWGVGAAGCSRRTIILSVWESRNPGAVQWRRDRACRDLERRGRRLLLRTCWLPPALWAGAQLYIGQYDGWGAWAAAPMLLPAVMLSVGMGAAGLVLVMLVRRHTRTWDVALFFATAIASSVIVYLVVENALRNITVPVF